MCSLGKIQIQIHSHIEEYKVRGKHLPLLIYPKSYHCDRVKCVVFGHTLCIYKYKYTNIRTL